MIWAAWLADSMGTIAGQRFLGMLIVIVAVGCDDGRWEVTMMLNCHPWCGDWGITKILYCAVSLYLSTDFLGCGEWTGACVFSGWKLRLHLEMEMVGSL